MKRSLISSMKGVRILILTPFLKWYLDNGLIVTGLHYFFSYNGKECLDWFTKHDKNCDKLIQELFEVEEEKRKVFYKLPMRNGLAVYFYAQLSMLEF